MAMPKLALLMLVSTFLQGVRCQDSVEQKPLLMISKEGENFTITCQYNINPFYSLHWYRQYPGKGPTMLLLLVSDGPEKKASFDADLNKQKRLSHFSIRDVQLKNAATYFCAVEAQ